MSRIEAEIVTEAGRRLPLRPAQHRPLDARCPVHLRRICGTCAGFPANAAIKAKGQPCSRLQVTVDGSCSAAGCKFWTRKSAASATPSTPNKKE